MIMQITYHSILLRSPVVVGEEPWLVGEVDSADGVVAAVPSLLGLTVVSVILCVDDGSVGFVGTVLSVGFAGTVSVVCSVELVCVVGSVAMPSNKFTHSTEIEDT